MVPRIRARVAILRAFGAQIGDGVLVRHRVRIHWPWKLTIGDNSWIGEGAWILNLEPVTIGANVCVSQDAFLCTGSHDRRSPTFEFDNGPITIGDGAWVAARATVLRGVTLSDNAVIRAGSVTARDVGITERRVDQSDLKTRSHACQREAQRRWGCGCGADAA